LRSKSFLSISKLYSPFFVQHMMKHKKHLFVTSLLLFSQVFLSILTPLPLKFILDFVLGDQTPTGGWLWLMNQAKWLVSENLTSLITLGAVVYFLIHMLATLYEFLQLFWLAKTSNKLVESTRKSIFRYLTTRNYNFIETQRKADLVGRLSQDTMILKVLLETGLPLAVRSLPSFFIIASLMASIHLWFGAVIIGLMFFMTLGSLYFSDLVRKFRRKARADNTSLEQTGLQALAGYALTKSMKMELKYRQKVSRYARSSSNNIVKASLAEGGLRSTMAVLKYITKGVILLIGGILTSRGEFSVGGIVLFMSYVDTLNDAMKDLIKFSYKAARSYSSLDRIEELLAMGEFSVDPTGGGQDLKGPLSSIQFKDVQFKYPGQEHKTIQFNGHFKKGKVYSLIGASGAGKSTILKMTARFFNPDRGQILFNGLDGQMIFVGQENLVISATVRDNLTLNAESLYGDDELWGALQKVNAHHFVEKLPQGLDTVVGEGGAPLSTGESQRICLSRAFVGNKNSLYIFDEPTTGLDKPSRERVIDSITDMARSSEAIMIFTTHFHEEACCADHMINFNSQHKYEAAPVKRGRDSALSARQSVQP